VSGRVKTSLRVAISVALLAAVVFVLVDPGELARALADSSLPLLVAVVLLHTGDRLLMAFKWWLLLRRQGLPIGLAQATRAYYISSAAGLLLPMTVGADLVRVVAMRGAAAAPKLVSSIALERAIGALSQALFCAVSLLLIVGLQMDVGVSTGQLAGIIGALLLDTTLLLPFSYRIADFVAAALSRRGPSARKLAAFAQEYADWRRHTATVWVFFLLTFVEGFFPIVTYWAASRALGFSTSFVHLLAAVPIVYLIARLPVSLGGIGVEEAFFVSLAGALGIPAAISTPTTLLSRIALIVALLPGVAAYFVEVARGSRTGAPRAPRTG
jgi:uncharacterized protein (TIRG00374 family)